MATASASVTLAKICLAVAGMFQKREITERHRREWEVLVRYYLSIG